MAFSEQLAARVRAVVSAGDGVHERRMFGGLAFLLHGHMGCGIVHERLMIRVAREDYEGVLRDPHVHPMNFTGRPMRGFVFVEAAGIRSDDDLSRWVSRGMAFASSLPPK